jgi:hypothetical protein
MIIRNLLIFFISGMLFSQGIPKDEQKQTLEEFFNKIKEILQKAKELQEQMKKKKNEEEKKRIRKKIIEKLSNPFYYRFKHKEIKIDKSKGRALNSRTEITENSDEEYRFKKYMKGNNVVKIINSGVKNYPFLMPFNLPKLKIEQERKTAEDRKGSLSSDKPNLVEQTRQDLSEILQWYLSVAEKVLFIWKWIENIFIKNEKGRKYFERVCSPAKAEKISKHI